MDQDNGGRFPDDSPVKIRYPLTRREEHGRRYSLGLAELARSWTADAS